MAVFKFVIGDGKKSYQVEKDQKDCPVLGKKIGNILLGDFLGLTGYELKITGGSDKDGFAMRRDINGSMRKKFILTKGTGFNTNISGLRIRRMLRGNTIASDIIQINCKVVRRGAAPLEEVLGKKEVGEPKEKSAEKKEEKKEPEKPEAKEKPSEKKEEVKKEESTKEKDEKPEKPETNAAVKEKHIPSGTKEEKTEPDIAVKEPAQPDAEKEAEK